MRSDKSKAGGAVIERRRGKAHRGVASAAIRYRERRAGSGVRRGCSPLPAATIVCVQMAAGVSAIGRGDRQRIVIVDVAKGASHAGVCVGQRKAGGVVIKHSRSPGSDRVASGASRCCSRESSRDVIRNISANGGSTLEGGRMASIAIRRTKAVIVVHMARRAGSRRRRHVCARQCKSGDAVIERRSSPACRGVAGGAIGRRKSRSGCGVHRGSGLLPGGQVALRISAIGRRNR